MQQYLTPDDYEIAEENGINGNNLYQRFYYYGMTAERARTKPLRRKGLKYQYLQDEAKKNGIELSYNTIYKRKKNGWSDEDVVRYGPGERPKRSKEEEKYYRIAEEKGIKGGTYIARRNRGWTREEASTTPVDKRHHRKEHINKARKIDIDHPSNEYF